MSRSYLRDKYMQKKVHDLQRLKGPDLMHLELVPESHTNNKHKRDEMPKNKASKSITVYCKDDIEHLNRATYCCGHSTNKDRRIVSGIVRAAKKRETQKIIKEIENG